MKHRRGVVLAIAAGVIALCVAGYRAYSRPEVYLTCRSEDGSWGAQLVRSRSFSLVNVELVFLSSDGSPVFSEVIDARDMWADVEHRYKSMACAGSEVVIKDPVWTGEAWAERRVSRPDA